jgi:hypothetical protein
VSDAGNAFDRGRWKVVVAELVSAGREPFLTSTFPRLLQVFPRTLCLKAEQAWGGTGVQHLDLAIAVRFPSLSKLHMGP